MTNATPVPNSLHLVDIVLNDLQRNTPTIVHPQFKISRIRNFYSTKVRYAAHNFCRILGRILEEFPVINELHPFWAALYNTLYHRDQYKLALARISVAKNLINKYAHDYVKMISYRQTPYECKCMKRAGLGIMCSIVRRLDDSLEYLEKVRQHMSRLPKINPSRRTLLLCGFPNVGKSSFITKVSRAKPEIQPYPGTTQSLFVGHFYHGYGEYQVIDTPGILDKPLSSRSQMEMQTINALAYLDCAVLFLVDISETTSWPIPEQMKLFNDLKPIFTNKPLFIVLTKTDLRSRSSLSPEENTAISDAIGNLSNVKVLELSNTTGDGVSDVRKTACEAILGKRKIQKDAAGITQNLLNQVHVAQPHTRDRISRPLRIPKTVLHSRKRRKNESRIIDKALQVSGLAQDENDLDRFKYELSTTVTKSSSIRNRIAKGVLDNLIESAKNRAEIDPNVEFDPKATQQYLNSEEIELWNHILGSTHSDGRPTLNVGPNNLGGKIGDRVLEKDLEIEQGAEYNVDYNKRWLLAHPDQSYDQIPIIWEGKNIDEFYDRDILKRLQDLEKEEETRKQQLLQMEAQIRNSNSKLALNAEEQEVLNAIRERKSLIKNASILKNTKNHIGPNRAQLARNLKTKVHRDSIRIKRGRTDEGEQNE